MPVLSLVATGLLLGLGAAAPIGPVNVMIIRRCLRDGFSSGMALGMGAVTIDCIYLALATLGVAPLVLHTPLLILPLRAGGILLLIWLGIMSLRSARREFSAGRENDVLGTADPQPHMGPSAGGTTPVAAPQISKWASYRTGLLMTATNPMTLMFWLSILSNVGSARPMRDLPMVCIGVFAGATTWVLAVCAALSWAGRHRRAWWLALADAAGGLTLIAFAVWMAVQLAPLLWHRGA